MSDQHSRLCQFLLAQAPNKWSCICEETGLLAYLPKLPPIHLEAKTVFDNAEKAFYEKRLQIQQGDNPGGGCFYFLPPKEGKPCGCAVGVSLPPEVGIVFDRITNLTSIVEYRKPGSEENISLMGSIEKLLEAGFITSDKPKALEDLQSAHDRRSAQNYGLPFLEELRYLRAKHCV